MRPHVRIGWVKNPSDWYWRREQLRTGVSTLSMAHLRVHYWIGKH